MPLDQPAIVKKSWEELLILGRPTGPRKSKWGKYQPEIEALLANGTTQRFVAKRYGTTNADLHNVTSLIKDERHVSP